MSSYPKLTPNLPSAEVIQHARRGFTLIELLMVFAVIAILAAITFGISSGVRNTQGKAKAKGELAMISQALDSFKMTHADFPWAAADKDATGDWENFGFVLYTMGPDGKDEIADDWDGVMIKGIREATDQGDPVNLDNIYAGE